VSIFSILDDFDKYATYFHFVELLFLDVFLAVSCSRGHKTSLLFHLCSEFVSQLRRSSKMQYLVELLTSVN